MSYLVFARKFRPQQFDEVVGQESIITTLKNGIEQGRIPQSFLFAGPRGTGKTSVARILAKALNCEKKSLDQCGGRCEACLEITEGRSMDVLEIDGASNRGIDEIRTLRETVKFKPSRGRYKVYIIDEVHMLTTEAFNALLKTLEEPPPHVKFIFATTEAHRVPLTILSRCQRFNFRRIPAREITEKLEEIAKKEKIKHDKKALALIAKASDGGLRDAESLLDQMASFCAEGIREEDVLSFLGLASEEFYLTLLRAIRDKDASAIFSRVHEFYEAGGDLIQLGRGIFDYFRYLLLFQCTPDAAKWADVSKESAEAIRGHQNDFSRAELLLGLSLLQNLQVQLRRNIAPARLLVETALLKLMHLDGLKSVGDFLQAGGPEPAAGRPGGLSRDAAGGIPPRPAAGRFGAAEPESREFAASKRREPGSVSQASAAPQADAEIGGSPSEPLPSASAHPAVSQDSGLVLRIEEASAYWPRVIDYVKKQRMSTGVFLSEAEPIEINDRVVVLGLPAEFQFHKDTLEKDANRRLVEEAFENVCSRRVRVQFVITKTHAEENAARPAVSKPNTPMDTAGPGHDILDEALNVFKGARLVRKE